MKKIVLLFLCLNVFLLSSCEKDIDIDYHEVPSLYVVEASVSNTNMEARISRSQNMDDNNTQSNINNAVVVITGDDGSSTLRPRTLLPVQGQTVPSSETA